MQLAVRLAAILLALTLITPVAQAEATVDQAHEQAARPGSHLQGSSAPRIWRT